LPSLPSGAVQLRIGISGFIATSTLQAKPTLRSHQSRYDRRK
jgi:hypothetical protein